MSDQDVVHPKYGKPFRQCEAFIPENLLPIGERQVLDILVEMCKGFATKIEKPKLMRAIIAIRKLARTPPNPAPRQLLPHYG
jgi:hypothetical protein